MRKFSTTLTLIICALLLIVFTLTAWLACLHKNATVDEPGHLVSAWILTHDNDFRCDCETPPLWKYYIALGTRKDALPIDRRSPGWALLLSDFSSEGTFARDAMYHTPGVDADALVRAGRARMLVIGVAMGVAIAWWAWRLGGAVAAVAALSAFCLDPNFMVNSAMIKNDVVTALALLLLSAAIWLLGERASAWRWLIASLMLGVALTVKFSGILGILILGLMLLTRALMKSPWPFERWIARTRPQRLALAAGMFIASLLTSWIFIWACYGFRYGPSSDPSQEFDLSDTLRHSAIGQFFAQSIDPGQPVRYLNYGNAQTWQPPAAIRLILWADNHHLLPQAYLSGLLFTYGMSQSRLAFLCGQSSLVGWWYYFPLAMIFKTPLTTLIALAAAAAFVVIRARHARAIKTWPLLATAITPLLYMLAAMHAHLNIGLRHVLPVYPFLFIFLGVAASMAWRASPRITGVLIALMIVGLAVETGGAYPDFVPFFNVAVGGARGGVNLLGDSNIDLGENLMTLAAWQQQHSDTPLYLLYWSTADPHYYKIRYAPMFGDAVPPQQKQNGAGPAPVVAVGAAILTDPYSNQVKPAFFRALARQQPIAVLGGSVYLYHLP